MGELIVSNCRGAALAEFSIVTIAFVPLMVGIPMIGRIIDLDQTAVQASRYVAWESTVQADGQPPSDVKARFFSEPSALISGTPDLQQQAGASESEGSSGRVRTFGRTALVPDTHIAIGENSISELTATSIYSGSPSIDSAGIPRGIAHDMGASVTQVAERMADATGGDWNLDGNGLLRSGVRVDIASNDWLSRSTIEETSVIMSDAWSVGNDASAAKRVKTFVPAGVLEKMGIGNMISVLGVIPAFTELRSFDDAFGHVEMGVLPASESARRVLRPYVAED